MSLIDNHLDPSGSIASSGQRLAPFSSVDLLLTSLFLLPFTSMMAGANWARYGFPKGRWIELLLCFFLLFLERIVFGFAWIYEAVGDTNLWNVVRWLAMGIVWLGYITWVLQRQKPYYDAFVKSHGNPTRKSKGGYRAYLKYFFASIVLVVALIQTDPVSGRMAIPLSQFVLPAATYQADDVVIQLPIGWFSPNLDVTTLNCGDACILLATAFASEADTYNVLKVYRFLRTPDTTDLDLESLLTQITGLMGYEAQDAVALHERDWGALPSAGGVYLHGNDIALFDLVARDNDLILFHFMCGDRLAVCQPIFRAIMDEVTLDFAHVPQT